VSDSRPSTLANLAAGDLAAAGVQQDAKGKFTTSRSEMGREHALSILNSPKYREQLQKRMEMGEGGAIEVWIWRIGYGDPPRPKEDLGEDEARFVRMRERLRAFMKESPEEARVMAGMLARQTGGPRALPATPPPPPDADSEKVG
jgi:hypothetical protein